MNTHVKKPSQPKDDKGFTQTELLDAIDLIDAGFLENALDVAHLDEQQRYHFLAEIANCKIDRQISGARVRIETATNGTQRFLFKNDTKSISAPPECFLPKHIAELTTARNEKLLVDVTIYEKVGDKPKSFVVV